MSFANDLSRRNEIVHYEATVPNDTLKRTSVRSMEAIMVVRLAGAARDRRPCAGDSTARRLARR
jgi:hypothetical protein